MSVLIPCFNERKTIGIVLDRVARVDLSPLKMAIEIIYVDDGSTDGSPDEVAAYRRAHPEAPIKALTLPANRGKGYAIRMGLAEAEGDFVIIQDADLEYFPEDWPKLLRPLVDGEAVAVYGSRKLGPSGPYPGRALFDVALAIENAVIKFCYDFAVSDTATCYKAIQTDLLRSLNLHSNGFEFCPEVTCKLLSRGVAIREEPIRYLPRGRRDGKKIKARHLFEALFEIARCRIRFGRIPIVAGRVADAATEGLG
ncbi:MAG: glycosyltransferase family 2 protein [Deltaproteobacteria bacterium]|nr:glycosyltransferase family 2 protein [Deltaproteobacteria bacterium]